MRDVKPPAGEVESRGHFYVTHLYGRESIRQIITVNEGVLASHGQGFRVE